MSVTREKQIQTALNYNVDKPPAKKRKVPYVKKVEIDSCESSDTVDSSGEEFAVDIEHGNKIIPHFIVHLPDQVMMGGTHQFHNTASAEASHKINIKFVGARARVYSDVNVSSSNLLKFSMHAEWFEAIFRITLNDDISVQQQPPNCQNDHLKSICLTSLIKDDSDALRVLCRTSGQSQALEVWDRILCGTVAVSVRELLSLTADYIGYPAISVRKLFRCSWRFGLHVHTHTSKGVTHNYYNGDWLETNITDSRNGITTSRLVRVVCGVSLRNFNKVTGMTLADSVYQTDANKRKDEVHFLLVRYAHPHPLTRGRRGPSHRPLCPGLRNTHCLWQWAKRGHGFRRGCLQARHWSLNKTFFGSTNESQLIRKDNEALAWYDLIQTSAISAHTNVQCDPDREDSFLQSVLWLG